MLIAAMRGELYLLDRHPAAIAK